MAETAPRKSVLVIGLGSIGERHLRCFQATGRVNTSVCEIDPELRGRIAQQYGVKRAYDDLETALADPDIDAAVIATPAHLHVRMATQLANQGVNLLIEKPLSTSLEGVEELEELIGRRGLIVAMGYVLRCHPSLAAMRASLESGRFGRPVQLMVQTGQHFPTYRPAYRDIYYANRATGGGAIQDALTHMINAAQWLIGPADRVVVDAAHKVLEGVEVEDTVGMLSRHADVMASFAMNQHQAPNETSITVVCTGGTVRWELHKNRWRWMEKPDEPWQQESAPEMQRDTLFIAQADAFLDALEGKSPPLCTLGEGVETLRAMRAALASVESSAWETVGG
jgi:predicted dehydrogenase